MRCKESDNCTEEGCYHKGKHGENDSCRDSCYIGKEKMSSGCEPTEKKFKFEIQSCIGVVIEADNVEDARLQIVDNIKNYAGDMVKDVYVSDGVEINKDA